jgi:gas vesicle protein
LSCGENKEKKGEIMMAEHEKPQSHLFMGFLIGSVLGALAGILFAPKSGKELRSDIKEKGSEVLKEVDRHLSEARQKAKEILARGEKKETAAGEADK